MSSAEIVLEKPDITNRKPVAIGVKKARTTCAVPVVKARFNHSVMVHTKVADVNRSNTGQLKIQRNGSAHLVKHAINHAP